MDYRINVVSGLPGCGKSYLLSRLLQRTEFLSARVVRMDEVGYKYWGSRQSMRADGSTTELTKTEKVYRNELLRNEVKIALVVEECPIVFVEAPLLTRRHHQKPFIEMSRDAERLLRAIAAERAVGRRPAVGGLPCVTVRVVLLYADVEIVRKRMRERMGGVGHDRTDASDFRIFSDAARQFEFPTAYVPWLIDTTDERDNASAARVDEVATFFGGSAESMRSSRLRHARTYFAAMKRLSG